MRSIVLSSLRVDVLKQFILFSVIEDRNLNEDPEIGFQCRNYDSGFAISNPKLIARK